MGVLQVIFERVVMVMPGNPQTEAGGSGERIPEEVPGEHAREIMGRNGEVESCGEETRSSGEKTRDDEENTGDGEDEETVVTQTLGSLNME